MLLVYLSICLSMDLSIYRTIYIHAHTFMYASTWHTYMYASTCIHVYIHTLTINPLTTVTVTVTWRRFCCPRSGPWRCWCRGWSRHSRTIGWAGWSAGGQLCASWRAASGRPSYLCIFILCICLFIYLCLFVYFFSCLVIYRQIN